MITIQSDCNFYKEENQENLCNSHETTAQETDRQTEKQTIIRENELNLTISKEGERKKSLYSLKRLKRFDLEDGRWTYLGLGEPERRRAHCSLCVKVEMGVFFRFYRQIIGALTVDA
nr:hypothetical protein Iba_chr05bCG11950 [Ipomoea batatas]GMC96357.1 hypothetical protein Iba_chr05cCG17310 [Ipomoea batatas]GMD02255.1 hypothetical protein Iba_chr05fCG14870 [Ipomoea batatas]GME14368.1 hypothetical protein Iba_scaffold15174CG0020 [Ipomoea batatas]